MADTSELLVICDATLEWSLDDVRGFPKCAHSRLHELARALKSRLQTEAQAPAVTPELLQEGYMIALLTTAFVDDGWADDAAELAVLAVKSIRPALLPTQAPASVLTEDVGALKFDLFRIMERHGFTGELNPCVCEMLDRLTGAPAPAATMPKIDNLVTPQIVKKAADAGERVGWETVLTPKAEIHHRVQDLQKYEAALKSVLPDILALFAKGDTP